MAELYKMNVNGELYDMSDSKARSDIASEITNRTNADDALQEKINTNKTGIDNLVNDVAVRNVKAEEVTNVPEVKLPLDEVKEEIEAAGNRVLNSIPDDYTQMNNKISELKGDLGDVETDVYEKTSNLVKKVSLLNVSNDDITVLDNGDGSFSIHGTSTTPCQIDFSVDADTFIPGEYYFSDISTLPRKGWYIWLSTDINNPTGEGSINRLMYTTGTNGGDVFTLSESKNATYLRLYLYENTPFNVDSVRFWVNKDVRRAYEKYYNIKFIEKGTIPTFIYKRYDGLKMNCLGDSITFGMIPDGATTSQMENPYPKLLKERLGLLECRNYGQSGTCLSVVKEGTEGISCRANAFVTRFDSMDVDSNINCIFGGVNDYIRNLAGYYNKLGTIDDDVDTTIYGALNILANKLITVYPKAFNFFITPLRQAQVSGVTQKPNNPDYQFTLEDVANAIREVAYKYSIPVLDLYSYGGFHIENDTFRSIYGGNDKLHPNQLFVEEHLAPMIEQFIRSHI